MRRRGGGPRPFLLPRVVEANSPGGSEPRDAPCEPKRPGTAEVAARGAGVMRGVRPYGTRCGVGVEVEGYAEVLHLTNTSATRRGHVVTRRGVGRRSQRGLPARPNAGVGRRPCSSR